MQDLSGSVNVTPKDFDCPGFVRVQTSKFTTLEEVSVIFDGKQAARNDNLAKQGMNVGGEDAVGGIEDKTVEVVEHVEK